MSISSDEVNYLVYRYLQESGFQHSAFAFAHESQVGKLRVEPAEVPLGALVSFLQKGLHYYSIESHLRDDGTEITCREPFSLISKHVCSGVSVVTTAAQAAAAAAVASPLAPVLHSPQMVASSQQQRPPSAALNVSSSALVQPAPVTSLRSTGVLADAVMEDLSSPALRATHDFSQQQSQLTISSSSLVKPEPLITATPTLSSFGSSLTASTIQQQPQQSQQQTVPPSAPTAAESEEIQASAVLRGHTSEVFTCSWNPKDDLLASGSSDATVRIWDVPIAASAALGAVPTCCQILKHVRPKEGINNYSMVVDSGQQQQQQDVTTLDWSPDGKLLATGSNDGLARIWTVGGLLKRTLQKHQGPIFSLKWNSTGEYLLSGSVDKTAVVWDSTTGDALQQFEYHTNHILDVDWRDETSFATCSTDRKIFMFELFKLRPLRCFEGHEDEVNAIKWDPTGNLLASCSDDCTAKIWDPSREANGGLVHDLREHVKEIFTIRWAPSRTPRGSRPPSDLTLASASFDATVKLWNAETGRCVHNLTRHSEAVNTVAFSHSGEYLASGSSDSFLHIWSVRTGLLVKSFRGFGGIFEVCWNRTDDKVAACYSNNTVCVYDFRT